MRGVKGLNSENINNEVHLAGTVDSEPVFSHEVYGEKFLTFVLKVPRLSSISDFINITVSERLIAQDPIQEGDSLEIDGQFRSYNNYSPTGNKLVLTVFARDLSKSCSEDTIKNPNYIFLNGFVCKTPVYRITPFGREITDLLIAVNRAYNKSDYMPCIAWGRNARFSSDLAVGTNIKIWGRIQSREYQKRISETQTVTKTAFEISISKMETEIKEKEKNDEQLDII